MMLMLPYQAHGDVLCHPHVLDRDKQPLPPVAELGDIVLLHRFERGPLRARVCVCVWSVCVCVGGVVVGVWVCGCGGV